MNRFENAFSKSKKVFVPFITAGDPTIKVTEEIILALDKEGAGIIELGVPFSDPIAEGKVIQDANIRALKNMVTTDDVFDMVERIRGKVSAAIVFLTYLNPVFVYGYNKFFERCKQTGVDGVIIPDCPYEESAEFTTYAKKYDIKNIALIAPTSSDRIRMLADSAEGFIYLVSSLGVSGVRENILTDLAEIAKQIRKVSSVPICVGFGISTAEQAKSVAKVADGVIVGSAIVNMVKDNGENSAEVVRKYAKLMKSAINS